MMSIEKHCSFASSRVLLSAIQWTG